LRDGSWTLKQVLKRAVQVLQTEGIASLWFRVLGETVYRRMVLMERLLAEPVSPVTPGLPVTIGLLDKTEVDAYCGFRPGADPLDVRRRLEAGQWCFVARLEGRIVQAGWAVARRARIDYLDSEIDLAPDEVYIYGSYTAPDSRGRNLAPAQRTEAVRFFRDAGYRRLVAVVFPENRAGFRPLEKIGCRRFGVIGYVRIGPWRRDFCRVSRDPLLPGEPPATWAGGESPRCIEGKRAGSTGSGEIL
jgi:ribosomal protein S18 acetylase RimI-like enzyme